MLPIGPLMIEHRLIERMIALLGTEAARVLGGAAPDPGLLDAAVDFIRAYADRCHHGKEEDILFRELAGKSLSTPDMDLMNELTREHVWARARVAELVAAAGALRSGDGAAAGAAGRVLADLAGFYPAHIRKEDRQFFPASMGYFTDAEKRAMLAEMAEFDRKLIHEHYRRVVEQLEPPGARKQP